jgi:hypothetical protein
MFESRGVVAVAAASIVTSGADEPRRDRRAEQELRAQHDSQRKAAYPRNMSGSRGP